MSYGIEPSVLTSEETKDEYFNFAEYIEKIESIGIGLFFSQSFLLRDKISNQKSVKFLCSFLRNFKFDIIHTHTAHCSKLCMIALKELGLKIPILQTVHGWGTLKNKEQESSDLISLNEINKVIFISQSLRNQLIPKGFKNNNFEIIYNGLNCVTHKPFNLTKVLKLKKTDSQKIIGCIGSFDQFKNQKLIVDTIAKFNDLRNHIFIFIGDGSEKNDIQKLTIEHKLNHCIQFLGYKQEAYKYISSFDLLITSSISEGGPPLIVLESFFYKTLVIASNILPHQEIIREDKTGFLFQDGDSFSLYNAICKAIHTKNKKSILENAHIMYNERFNFDNTFSRYFESYRKLVATKFELE